MKKIYISLALTVVFLAALLLDWNIRQGSADLMEDPGSVIQSRDDDLLELEIGYPGGEGPPPESTVLTESDRRAPGPNPDAASAPADNGRRTVPRVEEPAPRPEEKEILTEDGYVLYEVQKGDTLSQIAMDRLGTIRRAKEIMDLNGITDPTRIMPGMKLKLPRK